MDIINKKNELKKYKFVIIGGGISGLAAGRKLLKEHDEEDFVILEAQDRIGGRILTAKSEQGFEADLGASWIGKTQTRMYELCKENQIQLIE